LHICIIFGTTYTSRGVLERGMKKSPEEEKVELLAGGFVETVEL